MELPEGIYSAGQERRHPSPRRISFHWRQLWREWMARRLPASRKVSFHYRNLYIFPTRAGLSFLVVLLLLLLVAINFENSLVYAFTFWLVGLFVVSILHTFLNLSGLTLKGYDAKPCFSGSDAIFQFSFNANSRSHTGVTLSWQEVTSERLNLAQGEQKNLALRYRTGPRGRCVPGRIKIESRYPLGLIRCWTWVDLDQSAIVYPRPASDTTKPHAVTFASEHTGQHGQLNPGSDDFFGLRQFQPGDNLKTVAWKIYAKTNKLNVRQFIDYEDERLWLDWEQTNGTIEQRLSQLCHLVLEAENGVVEYGLRMPGIKVNPARGTAHLHSLLTELALYGEDANNPKTSNAMSDSSFVAEVSA